MVLFRPYERTETDQPAKRTTLTPKSTTPAAAPNATEPTTTTTQGKKDGRTPTRREAEAARMERLHPSTAKMSSKERRALRRAAADENWQRSERSPEREFLRDFVDARWTMIEFTLPAMLVFLAFTVLVANYLPQLAMVVTVGLWAFLLGCITNVVFLWRRFKAELADRFPKAGTRGLLMYLINRSMMIRRFRQPRPRLDRGASY